MWDNRVAAIGTDCPAVEPWPWDFKNEGALHYRTLSLLGLPLGEQFVLDDLAADCASDRRYEFMLVSCPLNWKAASRRRRTRSRSSSGAQISAVAGRGAPPRPARLPAHALMSCDSCPPARRSRARLRRARDRRGRASTAAVIISSDMLGGLAMARRLTRGVRQMDEARGDVGPRAQRMQRRVHHRVARVRARAQRHAAGISRRSSARNIARNGSREK